MPSRIFDCFVQLLQTTSVHLFTKLTGTHFPQTDNKNHVNTYDSAGVGLFKSFICQQSGGLPTESVLSLEATNSVTKPLRPIVQFTDASMPQTTLSWVSTGFHHILPTITMTKFKNYTAPDSGSRERCLSVNSFTINTICTQQIPVINNSVLKSTYCIVKSESSLKQFLVMCSFTTAN